MVIGYAIRALDGELGHVEDFVVDDGSWAIADIDWQRRAVSVRLRRDQLKDAPTA